MLCDNYGTLLGIDAEDPVVYGEEKRNKQLFAAVVIVTGTQVVCI